MYNKVSQEILQKLVGIVGPEDVITDREKLEDFSHDEISLREIGRYPAGVAKPERQGVALGELSRAVEEAGLSFPPHPGAESAMIGGLIATNAGGSRAVRYGVIRNYVRGLEIVLPGGEITRLGGKLVKSSTGYSLLHLLIGSEGTLGVITRAIIQLLPSAPLSRSLVVPFDDVDGAVEAVPLLMGRKIVPLR